VKFLPENWSAIMEDRQLVLREKLETLLKEVAQVEVELSRQEKAIVGIPHYSVIESRAHDLARQLSREIQQRQMRETAAAAPRRGKCPGCGMVCQLQEIKRNMTSIDGVFEVLELHGHCGSCRRDFFPSPRDLGV
jgi:predicted  nucleic acid-binding Zn-ribbon protein